MTPRDVVRLAVSLVFANEDGFLNSDDGSMRTLYDGTCGFISDALDMLDDGRAANPASHPLHRPVRSGTRGRDLGGRQDQPVAAQHRQLGTGPVRRDARPFGAHHAGRHPFRRQVRGADVQLPADQPALRQGMEGRGTVRGGRRHPTVQGTFRRGTARHRRGPCCSSRTSPRSSPPSSREAARPRSCCRASPLFNGDAGSGPSNIRRWLFEKDYIDCIVKLPTEIFFRTGISTYTGSCRTRNQRTVRA